MDNILEVIMERLDHMDRGELETLNRLLDLIELRQSDPAPYYYCFLNAYGAPLLESMLRFLS